MAVVGVADDGHGPVVHLVTADERARHCPDCGTRARRSKGRRVTRPRDLSVGGRRPRLVWAKAPLALQRAGVPVSLVHRVGPASTTSTAFNCRTSLFVQVRPLHQGRMKVWGRIRVEVTAQ
ncbi:transposase family protein [Streptomyces sp. NPDC058256]|uniref:transposase family protein n=1 Tax=Streptomyces sp. NPDC058256 TaxID=3346408 RepID=UPI0036E85C56